MGKLTVSKSLIFVFFLLLAVLVVVGGCTQKAAQPPAKQPLQPAVQPAPAPEPTPAPAPAPTTVPPTQKPSVKTVYITAQGFDPVWTVIKAGDTVVWINNDTTPHWPASAVHPTHNVYPEPGGCIGSKFDACHEMVHGEQWNFTFNVKGTWSYHDHLKQTIRGRVEVD